MGAFFLGKLLNDLMLNFLFLCQILTKPTSLQFI